MTDDGHISDDNLERYAMGAVKDEGELTALEEHLLWCHACTDLVQETEAYGDTITVGLLCMDEP